MRNGSGAPSADASAGDHPPQTGSPIRRVALASLVGTSIEWYDFFIYGTASALVFGELFFPNFSPLAGTLAAFATFAVGFVARPLGAAVFGHFGDRIGRKSMLILTLMMMGIATFLMGFVPTYAVIGVWAPILMVVLRFAQGLAVGGEWGGAVVMAVEHAPTGRRGFYGSYPQVGAPVGGLLSTGIFALLSLMPDDDFAAWGWRVPFLVSIVLVGVGLFIRLRIMESPVFAQLKQSGSVARLPVVDLLRTDYRNVLLAAFMYLSHGVLFYALTVFTLSYATDELDLSRSVYLTGVALAAAAQIFLVPAFGALSDRRGRRPVFAFGASFVAIFALPMYWLISSGVPVLVWLAVVIGIGVGHSAIYGPTAALYSELFSARVRYSGASVGYQLGGAAVGFVPLVATSLVGLTDGAYWPITVLIAAAALVGLASVYLASVQPQHADEREAAKERAPH